MPEATRPPRRPPLSRDHVLQAAVTFADAHGLDALSMRKLAGELGVKAMSLYNHVANKDAMLDGMVDRVVGEIQLPQIGGDWREQMRRRALSAHAVLMAHPWATQLLVSRMNLGPGMLRYVNATLGCLREGGFSYALADHAWNALDSHIYGYTLQAQSFPLAVDDYPSAAQTHLPKAEHYPYLRELTEQVIAGTHSGASDFEFGLTLLLDGLERRLAEG